MEKFVYPLLDGKRIKIRTTMHSWRIFNFRGRGLHGIIEDPDTGKKYKVYGKSCGLPHCMCDSTLKEV